MSEVSEQIAVLVRNRGRVKAKFTRFLNFINDKTNHDDGSQIEIRLEEIKNTLHDFEIIHNQIEELSKRENPELEEFEILYYREINNAKNLLKTLKASSLESGESVLGQSIASCNQIEGVRLPQIGLISFDGAYDKWLEFRDSFISMIHNKTNLSDVQKLHYLRSCLKDEAASVINALQTSAENYKIAWDLLRSRFENRRLIIQNHTSALINLNIMTRESSSELRSLINNINSHMRALKALGEQVDAWDTLLIQIIIPKLDKYTSREWQREIIGSDMPNLTKFLKFLEERFEILEATCNTTSNHVNANIHLNQSKFNNNTKKRVLIAAKNAMSCVLCKGTHKLFSCEQFLKHTIAERINLVKSHKLCINCFNNNHRSDQCTWRSCNKCNKKHNSLLHLERNESNSVDKDKDVETNNYKPHTVLKATLSTEILLSTAIINFESRNGGRIQARVILDSGSQSNFITKNFADRLGIAYKNINLPVEGLSQMQVNIKHSLKTKIFSNTTNYSADLEFLVIPRICDNLPSQYIDKGCLNIPQHIQLADPEFYKPSQIDALIGVEVFYDLMCVGQISTNDHRAKYTKTKLGWVISGKIINTKPSESKKCFLSIDLLQRQMTKFWEIEEITESKFLSEEESRTERFYKETTRRDAISGRYIVRLPFNEKISKLGESYRMANRRFLALEKRLATDLNLKTQYDEFMREYIKLNHMTEIANPIISKGYYMPHHAVIKESSQTTKTRVVFDASAKTSTGIALNNCLNAGPTIQQNIFNILVRFRVHTYVITADIEKMYRQILVDENDAVFQKILYRENKKDEIKTYRANTVTYGTTAAPFLAIRTLFQLAEDVKLRFPKTSEIIKRDFYVDDLLTGASTINEVMRIKDELCEAMKVGGFSLRKWASNSTEIIKNISVISSETDLFSKGEVQGILGVQWDSRGDILKYNVKNFEDIKVTKRNILSNISKIYDPIGLLGPVTITAKLIMQKLWQCETDWDESVPLEIYSRWKSLKNEFPLLNKVEFERKIVIENSRSIEVHGFADASEKAYGACIYIKSTDIKGNSKINLVCAKTRVAPLKSVSLPRLELCGALLLSRLFQNTMKALELNVKRVYLWTDSTITLQWVRTEPHLLKTFVANRVAEIRNSTNMLVWRHVSSKDNPADFLSRGQMPSEFIKNSLWKTGPRWLKLSENDWPKQCIKEIPMTDLKPTVSLQTSMRNNELLKLLRKYSTLNKLKRVTAYVLRYLNMLKTGKGNSVGSLSTDELREALKFIIKLVQREIFFNEYKRLSSGQEISSTSELRMLNPFLDNDGLIRVGGRLAYSVLPYTEKYPLVLPKNHPVTELIITEKHVKNFHSGVQATLHAIRQDYWPIAGKNNTRKIIRRCVQCFRVKPRDTNYVMGDLPRERITRARPFLNVGVDYCGPFFIKERRIRNRSRVKVYVALFVCFVTKACHLELVTDLTTDAFMSSLRRCFARRGRALNIYSDNATNFVGANREIKDLIAFTKSELYNNAMHDYLANEGITWHFSPPRAPHFGGLWEAGVKAFKQLFTKTIGNILLTYEELSTYITEIEAILNSRPITPLSSDPNDLRALSPAHFIIGEPLTTIPDQDLQAIKINRCSTWQHLQLMRQHFWKRWTKEYLHELNVRTKWQFQRAESIKLGTMVVIKEDNLPPLQWKLGRIVKIYPGKDGIVRVVSVKTHNGTYDRSVKNVSSLPFES